MTTITIPRRLMRPVSTRPARRAVAIGFGATLLAGVAIAVATSVAIGAAAAGTVLPGITVGGVELSGLDRAAATQRLEDQLPSLSTGQATIVVGDGREVVAYADLDASSGPSAMVAAGLGIGRDGSALAASRARPRNLARPASLPLIVHPYDTEAIDATAAAIAGQSSTEPDAAAVVADGAAFDLSPSE